MHPSPGAWVMEQLGNWWNQQPEFGGFTQESVTAFWHGDFGRRSGERFVDDCLRKANAPPIFFGDLYGEPGQCSKASVVVGLALLFLLGAVDEWEAYFSLLTPIIAGAAAGWSTLRAENLPTSWEKTHTYGVAAVCPAAHCHSPGVTLAGVQIL